MTGILSLFTPLLLHMVILDVCAGCFQKYLDATACTALASVIVIPIAGYWYWKDQKKQENQSLRTGWLPGIGHKILYGAGCLIAGGVLNLLLSQTMELLHITQKFSNQVQEALLASELLIKVIGLGIFVPAAEELIFRGLIYNRMKQLFPVKLACFFSALLFAVYHGNPIQMIFAFPMALALCVIYEYGGCLIFPILFHAGSNLLAVFW